MNYSSHMKTLLGGAIVAVALTATATPAFASNREIRSITVKYKDLDLTTANGETRLRMRVKAAMNAICKPVSRNDLRDTQDYQRCLKEASTSQKTLAIVLEQARSAHHLATADQTLLVRK